MDTTEEFIKMADTPEIQKKVPILDFTPRYTDGVVYSGNNVYWAGENNTVWLPRQDQLQEMALPTLKYQDTEHLLRAFNEWDKSEIGYEPFSRYFTSMEQLWLAFVMKEKYNKMWDGDKWERKLGQ